MWPDRRLLDLFGIEHPILLAPMAGAMDAALAIAVAQAGGLGSLPGGMLNAEQLRAQVGQFRAAAPGHPINLNFFAHKSPVPSNAREHAWRETLKPYYAEFGIDPNAPVASSNRAPFDDIMCAAVEEVKPEIVSFHYGLPAPALVQRVKAAGCKVIASATTVAEARFLAERGCDAVIAQGLEAGGHRGMFLTDDLATQIGTFALVPQLVDAVAVPVIATGGIGDARAIAAALMLGASAVQLGTAYLFCPEAKIAPPHRAALKTARDVSTAVTNVMTGRPARGIVNRVMRELGPINPLAPEFPLAGSALAPLHAKAQAQGSGDFSAMWAGQAAGLGREMPARDLTLQLVEETQALLGKIAG
ncbi:MAG TPA: nitronate monooxygenase family protein [Pseudolabrys sp.]|nr:nitronate monooxygenase family protein [Pseudolabrys sp.]